MKKAYKIVYVDDDPLFRKMMLHIFNQGGQEVIECSDSTKAVELVREVQPDCVITDLMMPGLDGMELVKRLRAENGLKALKIIIISSKSYEFDKNRAFKLGANGYILKSTPTEEFLQRFRDIVEERVLITCWGARGTIPVPGEKSLRHGGNTACVTMEFPRDNFFIFDAGTGLKELSDHLLKQRRALTKAKLFISHPHWDHINAFPFFVPLYMPGNDFEIMGAAHGDIDIEELLSHQMDGVYFPINIKEFGAHMKFRNLNEESFEIDGIKVSTMLLNHPGNCLGYRVEYQGKVLCYITDNELYPEDCAFYDPNYRKQLTAFAQDADVLITDCCYRDDEYIKKINWGHSRPLEVTQWAHEANIKHLYLFHHDPSQDDDAIDAKVAEARTHLQALGSKTEVFPATEREIIEA